MSKFFKFSLPALLLAAGLGVTTTSYAKKEYTVKEKKSCTYCHNSAKPTQAAPDLNDIGKCYEAKNHSLAACAPK